MKQVLWWVRRDLRATDNSTVAEAARIGEVHPVAIDDEKFTATSRRSAYWKAAVGDLHEQTGGVVKIQGEPGPVLLELAGKLGAKSVCWSRDFGPYGTRRDGEVRKLLELNGIDVHIVEDAYLQDFSKLTNNDGSPIRTFAAWRRKWSSGTLPAPVEMPDITWGEHHGTGNSSIAEASAAWQHARLSDWVETLSTYPDGRDHPGRDACSKLSAGIRFGLIHPRSILAAAAGREGSDKLADELCWREWYAAQLAREPRWAWDNQNPTYDKLEYSSGAGAEKLFQAWCEGRTGYPMVDAGMRELVQTGYMHNRVRMITASFLVKHLHIPWQWGARFFLRHLYDGDLASNNLSWQWVAGVGLDAAPYFRIMNPVSQAEKFDPEGVYIRTHISELSGHGGEVSAAGAGGYARPIVDLAVEREEALQRYKQARS